MKAVHTYIIYHESNVDALELMTQILSVSKFKEINPNIPFCLYTNSKSLEIYTKYGIDLLYDEINIDILDNYPSSKINKNFWASPKLWVLHHINEPVCIMDTDLVLYESIQEYNNFNLAYLHRESPASYPRLYEVSVPKKFKWTDAEAECFRKSLPINCACIVWNDVQFLKEYTTRYFEFVLGNKGTMFGIDSDNEWVSHHGPQILAEQWLLAAMIEHRELEERIVFAKSICPVIYASVDFIPFSIDDGHTQADVFLSNSIFHLWGGKKYYQDGKIDEYLKLKITLLEVVKSNLLQTGKWSLLENTYNNVKSLFPY